MSYGRDFGSHWGEHSWDPSCNNSRTASHSRIIVLIRNFVVLAVHGVRLTQEETVVIMDAPSPEV